MTATRDPNIVLILADDLGLGDVRHCDSRCAWPTPAIDRLGREGLTCSDAHTSSAVCTPSRYSLLTGRYCWRTQLKRGVIAGASPALLEPGRLTLASLLRGSGYRTGCFGKWHLGWDWACRTGLTPGDPWDGTSLDWIDYERSVRGGPLDHGFETFFGISGSLDMPPYVYLDGDRAESPPNAWAVAGEFLREGPRQQRLRAHAVLGEITTRACDWMRAVAAEPFLCYLPLTAPHSPISPAPEFLGASGVSTYGDFCMEVDARVAQVLSTLAEIGQDRDTLVIFTSDNGASAQPADCATLARRFGHYSSSVHRGFKSDIWDGGHRVPFLLRWPNGIEPGQTCDQPIGIFDLLATLADLLDRPLADNESEDSLSFLPALRGGSVAVEQRLGLVHHSIDGRFALRHGRWKLCRCPGSGGWSLPDSQALAQGLPPLQLYDMGADVGERRNLAAEQPELVADLTQRLQAIVHSGRSTPGLAQAQAGVPGSDAWPQVDWLCELPPGQILDD